MASLSLSAREAAHRSRQQLTFRIYLSNQAHGPAMGLVFVVSVAGCNQYALFCTSHFALMFRPQISFNCCVQAKSLTVIHLSPHVIHVTQVSAFGAANASLPCNKE